MRLIAQIVITLAFAAAAFDQEKCYTLVNATNHEVEVHYDSGTPVGAGFVTSQKFAPGAKIKYCTIYRVNANITTANTIWEGNHGLVMGPDGSAEGTYRMLPK